MNFDDHDWELGQPPANDSRDPGAASTALKVAAGAVAGVVLGAVVMHWVDRQRTAPNSPAFERLLRDAAPPAAGAAASLPGISPAPAPALAPASAPLMGAATAQAAVSVSDAQPDPGGEAARREARHAAELRAAERRERAWALSYKKPALCDDNPNKAIMVECANDYIRARREFEEIRGVGPTRSLGPRGAP